MPENGATDAALDASVQITFSEAIQPGSVTDKSSSSDASLIVTSADGTIAGALNVAGAVVTFTPSAPLLFDTDYRVRLTTGIKDLAGNALRFNFAADFTTIRDTTAPTLLSRSPDINATGVPLAATISVTFSEEMTAMTINGDSFQVTRGGVRITGQVTYAARVATFTPSGTLSFLTPYTVTLTNGIQDSVGNSIGSGITWSFTTSDGAWGTAQTIEPHPATRDASLPALGIAPNGNALAVWRQRDTAASAGYSIFSNQFVLGSGWEAEPALVDNSSGQASDPQVTFNEMGNAMAVWRETAPPETPYALIRGRRHLLGSGWETRTVTDDAGTSSVVSAILAVSSITGNKEAPQLVADMAGNAIFAWSQIESGTTRVFASQYSIDGNPITQVRISPVGAVGNGTKPKIAWRGGVGNALIVWEQILDAVVAATTTRDTYANVFANNSAGSPSAIETSTDFISDPQIASDPTGNAIAVWVQGDNIYAARYLPGPPASWQPPVLLEDQAGPASSPQLVMIPNGNAVVVWRQRDNTGTIQHIYSNSFINGTGTGTGWQGRVSVEQGSVTTQAPQLALDGQGRGFALWVQAGDLYSSRLLPAIGWQTPVLVEQNTDSASAHKIQMDGTGNAIAVYVQGGSIYANRFQ